MGEECLEKRVKVDRQSDIILFNVENSHVIYERERERREMVRPNSSTCAPVVK